MSQLLKSYLDHYQKDSFSFQKDTTYTIFVISCFFWISNKFLVFTFLYMTIRHSQFCMDMNGADPFICYGISAVALPKCLALSDISSGVVFQCCHLQCLKCHGVHFSTQRIKHLSITKNTELTRGFIKPTLVVTFIIFTSNPFFAVEYHQCYIYYCH